MPAPLAFPPSTHRSSTVALDNSCVWRASELNTQNQSTLNTGYTRLNRVLPGGGWPLGAMVEVLQPHAGQHEWGLLMPALAALATLSALAVRPTQARQRPPQQLIALTGAPYLPFGPALGACQLHMPRLLSVHAEPGNAPALLWATREALLCADVAVVLAWLPDARSAHLRRLQIAAHTHNKLLFVFRPLRAQHESSPAPVRLRLEAASAEPAEQGANLQVHVLKRRGPPLESPVLLDTLPGRLSALLAASRERVRSRRVSEVSVAPAVSAMADLSSLSPLFNRFKTTSKPDHALDRTASLHH